jgi:hypothetical protein
MQLYSVNIFLDMSKNNKTYKCNVYFVCRKNIHGFNLGTWNAHILPTMNKLYEGYEFSNILVPHSILSGNKDHDVKISIEYINNGIVVTEHVSNIPPDVSLNDSMNNMKLNTVEESMNTDDD